MRRYLLFLSAVIVIPAVIKAQSAGNSVYTRLSYVNSEWLNQADADPGLKKQGATFMTEQQLIQLHLTETEKLLRSRDTKRLSPQLRANRTKNLDVLHSYTLAGKFPVNDEHMGRQPYFIDKFNTYCAVGYLMKESGGDDIAKDIERTQNSAYLKDIDHPRLMDWVKQSGLTIDELALIQPGYGGPQDNVIEMHYNNTGPDVNEYIEVVPNHDITPVRVNTIYFYDGANTLYKTLTTAQMQVYNQSGAFFYYYIFPAGEDFANAGRVELWYKMPGNDQLLNTVTYTSNSVQVSSPFGPQISNVGEDESTSAGTSLTVCGQWPTWRFQSIPATIGAPSACTVLPIALKSFSYVAMAKSIDLLWETATEQNSSSFVIQRSSNGIDFTDIGSVPASGSSISGKQYSFTDHTPGYINHYRLKQVDADGKLDYSKILYVKLDIASGLSIEGNPVTTTLHYRINADDLNAQLVVYDINGKKMLETNARSISGDIDVSRWIKGTYLIRLVTAKKQVYTQQFVKQ